MTIKNDRALDVALGNSRKTKVWRNETLLWSQLLDRMTTTTRTSETQAEYKAMTKDQQAGKKDVGGFVGGYCKEGRRANIAHRSVLCLDADYADGALWDEWEHLYGNAAAIYSTHKHTPAKQRLRLVIPLARNVSPEEYPAIGRRVAAALGIDKFDDTTYEPQRVMFWPSTSRDGEYVFRFRDGAFLDPDKVLATYTDWRDITTWPVSSRVSQVIRRTAAKQQDPLEKKGVVGAFCRAYTIQEAIEAYVPEYAPCDVPNRYTYTEGSTAAGVVVYEDKFSYSHHATDPASSQLVNAWDLVRLHKFHGLDEDSDPDTPVNSLPSYKAMAQLASEDSRVKSQIITDRTGEAMADFEALPDEDTSWRSLLKFTEKGVIAQTIENVVVILTHDPKLAGKVALNEMEHNIFAMSSLPWRKVKSPSPWTDTDDAQLRLYLERVYGLTGKDRIFDAVNVVAQDSAFHPVRKYLDSCAWDGVPRVETLLVDYLGAEDTPYTRAVTRKTMAAAVTRIYKPGCKFDYMLTLQGRQGLGKSAFIAKLGGDWYSDTFTTMQGKEAFEQVQGVWLMEVGELAGMRKAEAETIKLFISKTSDRFRPAYGRRIQEFPRQCVFFGTTNETQFLRDTTGNRRFWVVDTPNRPEKDMWDELTTETVRLIWGEAVMLYKAGEKLYLDKDMEAAALEVQESYEEDNPRAGLVEAYLDRLLPEGWEDMDLYSRRQWLETDSVGTVRRTTVCPMEILAEALGGNPERADKRDFYEIRAIVSKLPEWRSMGRKKRTIRPYGQQRYYERSRRGT